MRLYIAVTDNDWFRFHAQRKPNEVNFWRPGGGDAFRGLDEGEPLLFKLHSPENYIAGGGFFVSHTTLSLSMAWRIFEEKNGSPDFTSLKSKILRIRGEPDLPASDPVIGCTILAIPFFFPRNLWIPAPSDWHPNVVQGKGYDASSGIGREMWQSVLERLSHVPGYLELEPEIREKGLLYVVERRQGQGAFRTKVLDAYSRRCAISGERTEPALEASHIRPYEESGPNRVNNGLLLRADLHQIFDAGYITVTSTYKIEVSRKIKEQFENGREYYRFNGQILTNLPSEPTDRPSVGFIEWHNEHLYRG